MALSFAGLSRTRLLGVNNRILGANDRIRIGMIGCGNRSGTLLRQAVAVANCEIVAIADPDTEQMEKYVAKAAKKSKIDLSQVTRYVDYRKLLEYKDVDAVIVASPNHWHTLHAIHAMQAGKAVYLEKPVTHDLWQGKQLLAAVDKYKAVVVGGFQNRSDTGPRAGIAYVQEGNLGSIQSVHVCTFRNRRSIGMQSVPLFPPSTVDYNLWLGPGQDMPMYRPRFHYDWHWVWNTGNGDIGNQTPHELDMACWVLGDPEMPREVFAFGNRFGWNDAGNTPNMIAANYVQSGVPVTVEVNDMRLGPERNVAGHRDGIRVGIIVKCEKGILKGGRGGMMAVESDGRTQIMKFPGDGGMAQMANFMDAVRRGDTSQVLSRIDTAERSSGVAHLCNLSYRAGKLATLKDLQNQIAGNQPLETIVADQSPQLEAWGIAKPQYYVGEKVSFDPDACIASTQNVKTEWVRGSGRGEFVVPEVT